MSRIVTQVSRIAAWLSQGVNCILLGGHHDQTISARCYVNRGQPGWIAAYRVINAVFVWQRNHCLSSHARDVEWAREVMSS